MTPLTKPTPRDIEVKFCVPCNSRDRTHIRGNCIICITRPQDG